MKEKRTLQVDRWEGPWIHDGPIHVRMSKPWFEFLWPFEWLPKKETKEKLYRGVFGFSITWRVDAPRPNMALESTAKGLDDYYNKLKEEQK